MRQKLTFNQNEIDWAMAFSAYALNRDTRIFENCSYAEHLVVEIWDDKDARFDENDVSTALADERLREGYDYDFTLYNTEHRLIGFAYYEE
jgi:hypothetical protein